MLFRINKYAYLFFAFCLFVAAAIIENGMLQRHPENGLIADFQKKLIQHEQEMDVHLGKIAEMLSSEDFLGEFNQYLNDNNLVVEDQGVGFLIYENGNLLYWSDRAISFNDSISDYEKTEGLVKLPNGYYLGESLKKDDYKIIGLHLIKYNYGYENKYLKNTFFDDYKLPDGFMILDKQKEGAFPVVDEHGEFLFSILPVGRFLCTKGQLYWPGAIYLLGLLILLFYFRREFVETVAPIILKMLGLATALFIVYWLHLIFKIPKVFFLLQFFNPGYFALNDWLPSLGDFFLLSLFFFFWMYNFSLGLNISEMQKGSGMPRKIIIMLLLFFAACTYLLVNFYFEKLIFNSTISFSLNKIIDISAQSVLGIFSIGLFLIGILMFTIKICEQIRNDFKVREIFILVLGITLFLGVIQYIAIGRAYYAVLLFFVATSFMAIFFSRNYLQKFTLSYLIIFVSVTSFYSLVVIYHSTSRKEREQQKLRAVTLVSEHDPAAEVFLGEIQKQIDVDPEIPKLLFEKEELKNYIKQTYFSSYFRKYIVNVNVCADEDSLYVVAEDRTIPCFPFFEDMIKSQGIWIPGTHYFYFMDNMNGRISYTGRLEYSGGISIFIDLDSDLLFEGIGFPELLIDKAMSKPEDYKKFDYAKYFGGELTDKYGDYNYNFYVHSYLFSDKEFSYGKWDGMEHLIYHTRGDNYVIVSRKMFTLIDYLISFPYLFVFYFLLVMIFMFIGNRNMRKRRIIFDLKFKIQAAIISIVFVSLLVVALVTILYNVERYKTKHSNDLDEKMKSIAEEIDMRLEDVDEIDTELEEWLYPELIKLSNIFRTDINIYGTDGELIASSRREIFDRGLVSKRINAQAYYEIYQNFQISYFQPEKIGQLSYLSAYRPIINYRVNYLGFINLPYFIRQDNYSQEISTFVVAFINLYVLLFLASIIVAVFISNQITRPLVLIQSNLQKMVLGKRNEPIQYNRKDEIGSLVKEYNKKVEELAVSADLLARSERESAWREMAKQIAHEIKNPLTPMKLHIQHLQRTKGEGQEYHKYIERVSATLIEQIDNLSSIATEFSNFAKIPTARNQVFKLAEQLQKVIGLYETHDGVEIDFDSCGLEYIEVNADREQLNRAIINLIKNGIQSIPETRDGYIHLTLNRREHMAVIAVSDNGTGIPVELRDKLFSPSFTTKTSGMGLGLAIVKNIVENFSGKIWFETTLGKGTTFFLEIPVYEVKDNNINVT